MENVYERGIYTDLVRELANRGINIYVVSPREERTGLPTELFNEGKIHILKVKTGNITKTSNFIEKGISTLLIEKQYLNAIKKYFNNIHFDLVMYSTPPITFEKIVKYFKSKHKSKSYLILKDIFPQNAVDLGAIKENSIIYRYFKMKETRLYNISDYIGCMSLGNVEYIKKHNDLTDHVVEIFPNAIKPIDKIDYKAKDDFVYQKYSIPKDKVLFIYGGNLGKPQGIDFIKEVIDNFNQVPNGFLMIIGDGTEYEKINLHISNSKTQNVKLIKWLPKKEYDQILKSADVGLIFLDHRFTIPNIPSRLLSYFEYSIPVLAATDKNTDLKEIINESHSGFWCESQDIEKFIEYANILCNDKCLLEKMGKSGRDYLEKNFNIEKTVNILTKHLLEEKDNVQG